MAMEINFKRALLSYNGPRDLGVLPQEMFKTCDIENAFKDHLVREIMIFQDLILEETYLYF